MDLNYYYVRSFSKRTTSQGKPYASVQLMRSETESVSCNIWDQVESLRGAVIGLQHNLAPDAKGFISFDASTILYSQFFTADNVPEMFLWTLQFADAVPSAESFISVVSSLLTPWCEDPRWGELCKQILARLPKITEAYSHGYGARYHHHNYPGGLLQHTYEVISMYAALCPSLPFPTHPVICTAALLYHDYGKLKEYTPDLDYTQTLVLKPHPVYSAEHFAKIYGKFISASDMEFIQHIIYTHHGRLEWGSVQLPSTMDAMLCSHLDQISSQGAAMNNAQHMVKSPTLDRTVIKFDY